MRSSGEEAQELVVPERAGRADRERAEELVLQLVGSQADSLLRVARRYSLCADDAHDAYQRALEILMRHAARLDPERAAGWLHTVVWRHIGTARCRPETSDARLHPVGHQGPGPARV
jgi:DNA-directed RNA polymerase specialized sigma24 family protein